MEFLQIYFCYTVLNEESFSPSVTFDVEDNVQRMAILQDKAAMLVEHHLAKVDVESSNLFARSIYKPLVHAKGFFCAFFRRLFLKSAVLKYWHAKCSIIIRSR